jgi:glycine cleavage system aminomethyltransferase T/glycine/D-amino acid oxidase-like deaminating enzyme
MTQTPTFTGTLHPHARVVVIGGGVIGCSVAYHLAHMGCSDVVVLERHRLTAGTTWHSAGLMVTFGSTSETSTSFRQYTRDLYARLEAETGQATGFRPVGFIEVAADKDRLEEYRRVAAFNRACGVDVVEISPKQVQELFPLAKVDDLEAGFYVAKDGRVDPVDVTMALAKGARMKGVQILEGVACTGVVSTRGAVTGVKTNHGTIACELVINCGGAWGRELGALAGAAVPLQAAEHYYLLTDEIPAVQKSWPVLEDPASYGYIREEGGGLMVGLFEPVCAPWKIEGMPHDFAFGEIPPDWDRMAPYIEKAMARVPITLQTGVRKLFCGPESFTPDLKPCLGEAPELKNFFVAAGLNSIGILTGGGVGRAMAHWMLNGRPDVDMTGFHVDRLHKYQTNPEYRRTRTVESLGLVYQTHYPNRSMTTARGAKRSPIHTQLAARGAYFKDVSGWEGADWFSLDGGAPDPGPLTFGRPAFWESWQREHRACREGVILMDMSFMTKLLVQGKDAGAVLNWISAGNVDPDIDTSGGAGTTTYTQWLNEGGTLEADLTVTKLGQGTFGAARDDQQYLVVASDNAHRHVLTWLRRHVGQQPGAREGGGDHCVVTDVTGAYAQINLQGPKSRALLQGLTSVDLSNEAFPFRCAKEVDLGFARVLVVRITYLGELGYELYVPAEHAAHVYERIVDAGAAHGLVHAGLKALASLRMEKAYRDYGHDIDNTDSVLEVGLGFAVDLKKPGGFLGKDAVVAKKAAGLKKKLAQVLVKDPLPQLFHAEPIFKDGVCCGYVRAASYGHTLGGAVGLAMIEGERLGDGVVIDDAFCNGGRFEVDIAGTRYPLQVSLKPLYDPTSARVKG